MSDSELMAMAKLMATKQREGRKKIVIELDEEVEEFLDAFIALLVMSGYSIKRITENYKETV